MVFAINISSATVTQKMAIREMFSFFLNSSFSLPI